MQNKVPDKYKPIKRYYDEIHIKRLKRWKLNIKPKLKNKKRV